MKTIKSIKGFRILFLLILGTLAIFVISFSTLSESHSVRSLLTASNNTHHDRQSQASNYVVVDVLRKIERELEKLRSETVASSSSTSPSAAYEGKGTELSALSRTHAAFLAEIKTDLESLLLSAPAEGSSWADDHRSHTSNNNIQHPLIPNPNQLKSSGADQAASSSSAEEYFLTEEIRKYIKIKPNRLKKQNFMGANGTFTSIGHACFSMKTELERYMDYDVGELCNDDWKLAQKLMVHGCDPLPRRRCFSRAPQLYTRPYSLDEESSMWRLPDDKNVRWSGYKCKNFTCLAKSSRTSKGFFKCADCFNLTHHESPRWVTAAPTSYVGVPGTNNLTSDFTIAEVLSFKPDGSIRIGLDFSVGTGTFAARMREYNVTIVSATINLGAPFNEMIALRGLVPLYLTVNQRLPFFDNTLDLIHTTRFLDGWIDYMLLDFVLYDWDRVLRVGGLIWIDGFFCLKEDLDDYLDGFMMLRYKVHKWVVVPKLDKGDLREVSFSALLEKPPRPF